MKDYTNDFRTNMAIRICKANKFKLKDVNEYGSDVYWLDNDLSNLKDIDNIYKDYVLPTNDEALIEDFKEQYLKDYLDEEDDEEENSIDFDKTALNSISEQIGKEELVIQDILNFLNDDTKDVNTKLKIISDLIGVFNNKLSDIVDKAEENQIFNDDTIDTLKDIFENIDDSVFNLYHIDD